VAPSVTNSSPKSGSVLTIVVRLTRNAAANSVAETGPRDRIKAARASRLIFVGRAIFGPIMHHKNHESIEKLL
jgi:hypothetical protein